MGIGTDLTTTPSSVLTVAPFNSSSGRNISLYTSGAVGNKASILFNQTSGTGNLAEIQAECKGTNQGELVLRTSLEKRMTINKDGKVGIGTDDPADKLSIHSAPNSLVLGAKDTTRGNHIFQLLADDSAGHGELRLYKNSGSGTHEKTVEISSSGNSYFIGGNVGVGTASPNWLHTVQGSSGTTVSAIKNTGEVQLFI